MTFSQAKSRAMVLIIVLWAVALLAVVCIVFSAGVYLAQSRLRHTTADNALEQSTLSALTCAENILLADNTAADMSDDSWANTGDTLEFEINNYQLGVISKNAASWQNGWADEAGRINANTATAEILAKLEGMDEATAQEFVRQRNLLDQTAGLTGPIVDSYQLEQLLKKTFTAFSSAQSDEDETQTAFASESSDIKVAAIMDLLTVYTRSLNRTADGAERLNINTATESQLENKLGSIISPEQIQAVIDSRNNLKFENIAQLLTRELTYGFSSVNISQTQFQLMADLITASSKTVIAGLVNINTAGEKILRTLPGMTDDIVTELISFREFRMASENELGGRSIGWLLEVMSPEKLEAICNLITTRSNQFRCYVKAEKNEICHLRLFVVERYADKTAVLFSRVWRGNSDEVSLE